MEIKPSLDMKTLAELTAQGKADRAIREQAAAQAFVVAETLAREKRQQRIAGEIAKRLADSQPKIDRAIEDNATKGNEKYVKKFRVMHCQNVKGRFDRYPSRINSGIEDDTEITHGVIDGIIGHYTSVGIEVVALKPVSQCETIYDKSDGYAVGEYIRSIDSGVQISWGEPVIS